jgi:pSer/pThr/pTyr-binding forkhead associated (FHA) protein
MAMAEPLALEPIPMAEPEPMPPPKPAAPPPPVVSVPPAPPVPPPATVPAPASTAPPPAAASAPGPLPAGAQPRLQVLRGQKRNVEYPIYEGLNYIGRADEKPVDIDLEEQEPPDRIWCSRQHAVITFEGGMVSLEDLNSANGTYVNRVRVYPGQAKPLAVNDIVQIGNVQMKLVV